LLLLLLLLLLFLLLLLPDLHFIQRILIPSLHLSRCTPNLNMSETPMKPL
jgi:hypothetical protein